MISLSRLCLPLAMIATFVLVGCKPQNPNAPARVSGKVTYNGNAVTGGTITFHGDNGVLIPIGIGSDGNYTAFDIPEGAMVVTVETESVNPEQKKQEYRGQTATGAGPKYGPAMGGSPAVPKGKGMQNSPGADNATTGSGGYVKIPAKYADKATSGLSITLKKGEQKFNAELKD